mmetsp:Transcript_36289/g.95669  ORF Transcript_36289/g.95669 Transcript_36289/m.95669 type:complete len:153 (+) Transcript_36289:81-539(+)
MFTEEDAMRAQALCDACEEYELSELWCSAASGCFHCRGYPYRVRSDIKSQLGVCGCVVALEMESGDIYRPIPHVQARPETVQSEYGYLHTLPTVRGHVQVLREALYYLRSGRQHGRAPRQILAFTAHRPLSTQMKMRVREKKQQTGRDMSRH